MFRTCVQAKPMEFRPCSVLLMVSHFEAQERSSSSTKRSMRRILIWATAFQAPGASLRVLCSSISDPVLLAKVKCLVVCRCTSWPS